MDREPHATPQQGPDLGPVPQRQGAASLTGPAGPAGPAGRSPMAGAPTRSGSTATGPAAAPRGRAALGLLIAGLAALAIAAIVLGIIFLPKLFAPAAAGPGSASGAAAAETSFTTSAGPATAPVEVADDGATILVGQPDAKMTVDLWFDFSCPHCVTHHELAGQTLLDLVGTGEVRVAYHAVNVARPYGKQAAAAFAAVLAQEPGRFAELYQALYSIPPETQTGWGPAEYAAFLREQGLAGEVAIAEVEAGAYVDKVDGYLALAANRGVEGTPTVAVDGQILPEPPDGPALVELAAARGVDVSKVG